VVTLDDLLSSDPVGRSKRDAADVGRKVLTLLGTGLYRSGWLLAKLILFTLYALGGILYGAGWFTRRAVWPALVWAATAVRLGWEDGRKRAERR
jgi:hypothetical protein